MDPNEIELNNLSKSFAYQKIATEIDSCDDRDMLKNIAKSFCKLYYKQQETMQTIGLSYGD
jgi:hypothetical protein|nr:hypothetical protein [uncultured Mediterranean phage uvMED]|tara:strand:- start:399 stop:581 length:183 start_codon:yes stop_codon:yes gene_type:complete